MYDCECLIHPFQNDPGTSQSQRVMDDLLAGAAKIDARTLADLLDYFVQMSRHINFYDTQLTVSDWQPFFQKSIPFTLASVIKTPSAEIEQNFIYYNSLFEKKPSSTGLQLHAYFIYYRFINKINNWYLSVKDSGLPIENFLEILIKDKLQQPVKFFIGYTNAAIKWYGIRKIDFSKLADNPVWNIQATDLYLIDNSFKTGTYSKFQQINNLYQKFKIISSPFFDAIKIISVAAENNLEQSLLPLKEELQKKHPPHLGLLFAFLNIFRQLQNDLNGYTRKHLDFFYKDVLQIKSRDAIADKAHIIFEIQKQLEKYLIKKGLLVKDGKDLNKQEILFSLDDDIVVNKTEVAETKTLFLNNQSAYEQTYVEGVYIANDATKADGIDKDFPDGQPKNFPTLGAKLSKYSDPETKIIKPYPNARLGFILASPVLYLKEGTRTVDITLACELKDSVCEEIGAEIIAASQNCCDEKAATQTNNEKNQYPDFYLAKKFYDEINTVLNGTYYYISEDLIKEAIKKGISTNLADKLREAFLITEEELCYCAVKKLHFDAIITETEFTNLILSLFAGEKLILAEIIKPRKALNILFSGEKEWIEPSSIDLLHLEPPTFAATKFILHIKATLKPDKLPVTFYDKEKLKEDFDTTQPLVKIELDDKIKIKLSDTDLKAKVEIIKSDEKCCANTDDCCLNKPPLTNDHEISLYHFFRNIEIIEKIGADFTVHTDETRINVQVCGLKNFIVQNDESVQDVNGIILPFGSIPKIGSNFYIGCPEIFCKNWSEFNLKFNWKDKPPILKDYYHGYEDFLSSIAIDDFDENRFVFEYSFLENGLWKTHYLTLPVFKTTPNNAIPPSVDSNPPTPSAFHLLFTNDTLSFCSGDVFNQEYNFIRGDFSLDVYLRKSIECFRSSIFQNDSKNGFLKLTLLNQDFQHSRYPFVLTRQMMALGKWPEIYVGPVYDGIPNPPPTTTLPVLNIDEVFNAIFRSYEFSTNIRNRLDNPLNSVLDKIFNALPNPPADQSILFTLVDDFKNCLGDPVVFPPGSIPILPSPFPPFPNPFPNPIPPDAPELNQFLLKDIIDKLEDSILFPIYDKLREMQNKRVVIPNQPYTPQIKGITLDYTASATLEDIDLIHLYPYSGTYKHEEIQLQPTLFPTFCDEGTLFLGLKNLVPGNTLNLLFRLSEATSDSESEKEEVLWHYLDNNVWKPLRKGFEVLDDASENLTTSGIVKFALPANMTNDNTIMPKDLHWIKASIAQNSKAVSETTGIYPQAISVTFTNDAANDKLRLSQPLVAGSISKLNVADANVKSVQQPYDTFDGAVPEIEQQFYVRVSEQLRHKGRAIQKFDYERLALQEFPELFKAKCINHSFALDAHLYKNDFPYAPGYIILAVIPDLNKLKAGNSFEPKVPVSILEKIETYIHKRTSPFVRFRAMNPRYEKINFCLRVNLLPGKDENYYKEKLKEDIKELLAPWAVGRYDKLTFGQCVYRSDIIRFLENTDYVDFITDFKMGKELIIPDDASSKICPDTPRSILVAGDIEVCINKPDCDDWKMCIDANQNKIDCCTTEKIPVADYCIDKTIPIE